jgi:hypothetical protein
VGLFGFEDPFWQRTDEQLMMGAIYWSSTAPDGIDLNRLKRDGYARLPRAMPTSIRNTETWSAKCGWPGANASSCMPGTRPRAASRMERRFASTTTAAKLRRSQRSATT